MTEYSITLQEVTPADIEKYIATERKVGSKTYLPWTTEKEIMTVMSNGKIYFIKVGDNIVGNISYQTKPDGTVFIEGLAVDPKYQGKGFARQALNQILMQVKNAHRVELITHPENAPAVNLYQSLGFEIVERKDNYFGDGEPRILMRKVNSNG